MEIISESLLSLFLRDVRARLNPPNMAVTNGPNTCNILVGVEFQALKPLY